MFASIASVIVLSAVTLTVLLKLEFLVRPETRRKI